MAIQLTDVRFAYPSAQDKIVLDINNWSVQTKEQIFIHGPSGCGKSTLLNLLSGMLQTAQGEISILGEPLHKMSSRQLDRFRASHIGYIFQQFNLISYLNAVDNIQLASQFSKGNNKSKINEDIKSLLSRFNIDQSHWSKPINQLSIGQQQRIAIARAMINQPEIIIADEPTSSLDQDNRDNFMTELLSMVSDNGSTLLFVSHDMSLAQHFQKVVALSDINLVGLERPATDMKNSEQLQAESIGGNQ